MKELLNIAPAHIAMLRKLRARFSRTTIVPVQDSWRGRNNEEIWRYVIGQVMVVGGSASADRFIDRKDLCKKVSYRKLCELTPSMARKAIHSVLREVGCRYASSSLTKCRKTAALAHNLKVFMHTPGGPKGFLRHLSELTGRYAERRRIKYVMKVLWYLRSKSSRDFLMEQGLVRHALALDIRMITVLRKVGIDVPEAVRGNAAVYDRVESALLARVCEPLGMAGVEFDRLVYQNYDDIVKYLNQSS